MFKGYIPTGGREGKTPLEEYKDKTEFYDLESVKKLNHYGGVLKDNIIQIDVDDEEQSKILYKIITDLEIQCNILETSRGKHFYFINSGIDRRKQGYYTPIAIKIDIGLGLQNAVIPLKIKGEKRIWAQQVNQLDQLPPWLMPMTKKKFDFLGMDDGDGRNESLFSYILTLQSNGLSKEQIKETIKIINKFILKTPVDEKELEIILRDEAFKKQCFFNGNKFDHSNFAKLMIQNNHIYRINYNLYVYNKGYYANDMRIIKLCAIKEYEKLTSKQINEVIDRLNIIAPEKEVSKANKIPLNNGLYNIDTRQLEEFTPNYISKNKIPVNYNPAAYDKDLDKALDAICCNDKSLRCVIEEIFGNCLYRENEFNRIYMLNGKGSNGKSTILDLLKSMLGGESNVSSLALNELNDRFKTYQIMDKLVNIGDDIDYDIITKTGILKKLVTGETINVERKGKDAFNINSYAGLFFSSNESIFIRDDSDGLKRRLMNIPFNAHFTDENKDYSILSRARRGDTSFMEYMLKLSIEGLHRLLKNMSYTKCDLIIKANLEYQEFNNPILRFLNSELDSYDEILYNPETNENSIDEVFLRFRSWCNSNNIKYDYAQKIFSGEVKKITGFDVKRKRVKKIFLKDNDKPNKKINVFVK